MSNYIIEGNINFQEELYKLLDEPSDDENDICQITGLPLTDNYVTLECNHHFNYDALYKEIYTQKIVFKSYDTKTLTNADLNKFRNSKLDYYIKCPYCRNIQFTVLPYYKEFGLTEIYGINSLDKTIPNILPILSTHIKSSDLNYTYSLFGVLFKSGECCEKINNFGDKCSQKYVTPIIGTPLCYCHLHYRRGLKSYKMAEKAKIVQAKIDAKKKKMDIINERKKLLDEMNIERESNGMSLLKRLPVTKKPIVKNIVKNQNQPIQEYIPEEDADNHVVSDGTCCNAILKSGPNKGNMCGVQTTVWNGLCKRHCPKDQINSKSNV